MIRSEKVVTMESQRGMSGMSVYIVEFVQKLNKTQKRSIWLLADIAGFLTGTVLSYLFFVSLITLPMYTYATYTVLAFVLYMVLTNVFKVSSRINRYSGIMDMALLFTLTLLSGSVSGLACLIVYDAFSFRFTVMSMLVTAIFVVTTRLLWQVVYLSRYRSNNLDSKEKRIVVIGAGDGGSLFMNSYRRNPNNLKVVAILDQDPAKNGLNIGGIKVSGNIDLIPELAASQGIEEAIVAIPSLKPEEYEEILAICNKHQVDVYKMPKVEEVLQGIYRPKDPKRKINIADLLGRKEIKLDDSKLRQELEGKTILITGAGGSIGSEISRQVSRYNPKKVILLGHGENSIYLIYHEHLKNKGMVEYSPVIADVKDYNRLLDIFREEKPDIIYHAAAHKHVPLMEANPVEAFTNNILGTYNVAKAVDAAGVKKMVMISTDKAVNPPNVMGATKRVAELIVTGMNAKSNSIYCAVRFGNVLGSRGSVIPVFEQQIAEGGPITITDFRMTRYFMTIPEASRLVIFAGAHAHDGEVFILDMGEPVKIVDLAKKMVLLSGHKENEIEIVESGIRPGEKLYEELLTSTELVAQQLNEQIFVGKVVNMPLDEIEHFIKELHTIETDGDQLKKAIINFAHESAI